MQPMELPDAIKPKTKNRVIDLVRDAGFDISDWSNFSGNPATNPRYCYEWAFVEKGTAVLLNLWHSECEKKAAKIIQRINLHADQKHYSEIGKAIWAGRAKRMNQAIQTAWESNLPVRVILLDGVQREAIDASSKPSRITRRELDPEFWHIETYDHGTGETVLCRGPARSGFEDQFTLADFGKQSPDRRDTVSAVFERDRRVREWVMARANGHCEFCGRKGFRTNSNALYLETHHVTPLSEGGSDTVGNVIALCPNDHRMAHFGSGRDKMRARFTDILNRKCRRLPLYEAD